MCSKAAEQYTCDHKHFQSSAKVVPCNIKKSGGQCNDLKAKPIKKMSTKCTWCLSNKK